MSDPKREARDYLHDCDRNARYHTARRAFFDKWHRWMMFAVLISGSSAVAAVASDQEEASVFILLVPAVVGAFSVVWNLPNRARDHEFLARRFYDIASSISVDGADPERIETWRNQILLVYKDEPAVYHALNAECRNAASQALGHDTDQFQKVSMLQHHLRNLVRFSPADFPVKTITGQPSGVAN